MGEILRGLCLAPVLVLGLVVATSPARGAGEPAGAKPPDRQAPFRVEPASAPAPDASEGRTDEVEGRPGRDDPDVFYKKPPRKPKQKTRMHA